MTYQPLDWNSDLILQLKRDKIHLVEVFQQTNLSDIERFSFDRALAISNFLSEKGVDKPAILDLGSSGGVFSLTLKITLDAHATAVDDDRYIDIQGENFQSSIRLTRERLDQSNINNIITVNSSIEKFISELPPYPVYDVVLLLNILHHFYTGYGQCSEYGQMSWEGTIELLKKIGTITRKYLFFEINSLVIHKYEKYLTDIMYAGNFNKLEYVSRSVATDGEIRAIWCFTK